MNNKGSEKRKYCLIFNPSAGSGHAQRQWPAIEAILDSQSLDYTRRTTTAPGDAIAYTVAAAREGFDVIVAVGGDGTANEVINGLMRVQEEGISPPALGLISVGRGNDFAHAVGLPMGIESAVKALAADRRRLIDIGHVVGGLYPQGRFFGNCVGVGFDAVGTIEAAKLPRLGGFLSFLIAVLKTILLYHHGPIVRLIYDDEELSQAVLMVSVMNGQRLGGGFWMAPKSAPDDGSFDICVVRQVPRWRVFTLVPHFLRGTQATQAEITMLKACSIEVEALEGTLPAQTDGEILSIDDRHLKIELMPGALAVVTLMETL